MSKKKVTPEERLARARNDLVVGIFDIILVIGYSIIVGSSVSLSILFLIGGLFLLGMGIYYFFTQEAYADNIENVKPFATPVSADNTILPENTANSKPQIKKEKNQTVYLIYNLLGLSGLTILIIFLFAEIIPTLLFTIFMSVLTFFIFANAVYHFAIRNRS